MIIAIQAALMCEDVQYDEHGRPSYLTVVGGGLASTSRPGIEPIHIVLHLATDRKPGAAVVTVSAPSWSEPFPFTYPGNVDITGVHLQLAVPMIEPGELEVVVDEGAGRRSAVLWRLTFPRDAEVDPDPRARLRVLELAREGAAIMRDALKDRRH